jgi:LytS/YehU family sensor histidine kinase
MTQQEIEDIINTKLAIPTGYTFKTVIIACLVSFLVGGIIGSYITKSFFPNMSMPIVVTKEILSDPVKLTQVIREPYAVTKEIIKEIAVTKPSQNPMGDADKVLIEKHTQTTTNQYNIVLDRKKEIGVFATTESAGLMAGYAPNKNTMYHIYVGKKFNNSGTDFGGGVAIRF